MAAEPSSEQVAQARQAVVDARLAVEKELDDLGLATQAAFDIPAKIRRNPVRTVGLGAGAAFLLLGGPRRVLKQVEHRVFPKRRYRKLTPAEIDRAVEVFPAVVAKVRKLAAEAASSAPCRLRPGLVTTLMTPKNALLP